MQNDQELAQIASQSKGTISDETIVSHHPWVENPEKEMELLKAQEEKNAAEISDMFQTQTDPEEDQEGDD